MLFDEICFADEVAWSAFVRTVPILQREVGSNSSKVLNSEMSNMDLTGHIVNAGREGKQPLGAMAFVADDEGGFSLVVCFPPVIKDDMHPIVQRLLDYVTLRWIGISKNMALKMVSGDFPATKGTAEERAELRTEVPLLSIDQLKPIRYITLAEFPFADEEAGFIFQDTEISLLIRFHPSRATSLAIDSQEFAPDIGPQIRTAAKDVWQHMREDGTAVQMGHSVLLWELMQKELQRKGINWKSPADLNPLNEWP